MLKVKLLDIIRAILIAIICTVLMIYAFIGAVLQESYKLCPLTEEEMMEVQND